VSKAVTEIVNQLGKDQKWRIRLGVVQQLLPIAEKLKNDAVSAEFTTFCTRMLDDEAFPVRNAAIAHLARTFAGASAIPELVNTLAQTESFRKRQNAVGILREMHPIAAAPVKGLIVAELERMRGDGVSNVSFAAGQALASLAA
jgi:HEAT repeat protein